MREDKTCGQCEWWKNVEEIYSGLCRVDSHPWYRHDESRLEDRLVGDDAMCAEHCECFKERAK